MSDETAFKLKAFAEWVEANGGFIEKPTNEWEVLRYRWPGHSPRVLYRKKTGRLTFTKELQNDYDRFQRAIGKVGEQAVEKVRRKLALPLKRKIAERDRHPNGYLTCCYCGQFIDIENCTLEHFLPLSKGGPNHTENAALACEECNLRAGNLSVFEKIELRDQIRVAMASHVPWEKFDARELRSS